MRDTPTPDYEVRDPLEVVSGRILALEKRVADLEKAAAQDNEAKKVGRLAMAALRERQASG